MKKTLGLLSLLILWGSVSFGANLTVNTSNSVQTNCNGGVFNESYYLGKTPTRYFYDIIGGDINKHYVIGMTSSNAVVYNPYGVFQFQGGVPTFAYKSEIKPRGIQEVIVAHQNQGAGTDIVNHATSRSSIAGQIVYSTSRKEESKGTQANTTTYKYMKTDKSTDSITTNVAFNSNVVSDNECFNVYVWWCGDGILDNGTSLVVNGQSTTPGQLAGGETCDDGALNGTPGHCSITCGTTPSTTGHLTLVKTLVTNKMYFSGDIVEWKIDFTNGGNTEAINVVLEDILPISLEYVSSQIFGVSSTAKSGIYTAWGVTTVQYSGFSLKPGASGYLIVKGKLKSDRDYSNYRLNCSVLWASGFANLSSCALFEYGTGNTENTPMCRNITTNTTTNGKDVQVFCDGKNTTTSTPMSIDCKNGVINQGYANAAWVYSATCSYSSVSQAQKALISCTVANDTNNSDCISSPNACTIEGNSMVAIVGDDEDNDGRIKYTCETKNGQEALLQIDCGNGKKSSAETDNKITYTCKYDESDYDDAGSDKTIQAKCLVDGGAGSCKVDTVLDKGFIGFCGNGIREGYEQCDEGWDRWEGKMDDGRVCKRGCTVCDVCKDEVTQCLSLGNGNASVQSNEILPFWWRMYKPAYIVTDHSCDNKSQAGNIKRDTMKCSFSLRQPGQDKPVTILSNVDCDRTELANQALFANFFPDFWKPAFGNWSLDLSKVLEEDAFKKNVFGEYKIRLHEVDYEYCACDGNDCEWKDTQINNVCETDFPITRPYLIQKSAFGTFPKATDAKLTNFYDNLGNPLINKTDLADVMILDADAYNGGSDAKFLIISESNRIAKLAVTLAKSKIPSALQGLNVKKVPNKAIYLIESTSHKAISLKPDAISTTTPFTIITKNIDLTIVGSLSVNGMFITQNGKIIFQEDSNWCSAGPQIVKGIFVAGNGFESRSVSGKSKIENTNVNLSWCKYGNLQVKWVLIWDGIDGLVENRRSNLNNWFNVNGSEKTIKVQRRNQIFNWASLLIEYNTDLWKQLPPGAEQFVNLLDVYKK